VNTIARGNAAEAAVLQAFAVVFNAASTDHGRGSLDYRGPVYVPALSRVFVVPVDDCPVYTGFLRLDPPRNNQRRGVRFADDYAFERWLESYSQCGAAIEPAERCG
jgi:hypothetical protein